MRHLIRYVDKPIYLTGAILVLFPAVEAYQAISPIQFGLIRWRYEAALVGSHALVMPLLGFLVVLVTATVLDRKRILLVLSLVAGKHGNPPPHKLRAAVTGGK